MTPTVTDESTLDKLARTAGDLPTMPDVIDKVLRLVQDPETEVDDLKKVIEHDPGLTSKLLRVANSAFYQRTREISSLNQAILTLGFKTLLSLTLASSTKTMFDQYSEVAVQVRNTMWDHSISTAFLANMITKITPKQTDEDLCFLGGLLHDVGKLVISRNSPTQFTKLRKAIDKGGVNPAEVEMEILGFRHEDLGAHLAKEWNLPEPLEMTIQYHHDFQSAPEFQTEAAVVNLANRIATDLGWNFPCGDQCPLDEEASLRHLDIDAQKLEAHLPEMKAQVEELKQLF